MRLTKKLRNQITIELWTFLAETGKEYKDQWGGWDKYGVMLHYCPLCEYDLQHKGGHCLNCPITKAGYAGCEHDTAYLEWWLADTVDERKKYAKLCLAQLKEILE